MLGMRNVLTSVVAVIVTLTFLFGGYYLANMKHSEHGTHCPFMLSKDVICTMETREHIRIFSNIFISTLFKVFSVFVFSTILLFIFRNRNDIDKSRYRIYINTQNRLGVLRNLLLLLFSSGILNPKAP
jgi:hypothetical protein